jgi:hypothetical protein
MTKVFKEASILAILSCALLMPCDVGAQNVARDLYQIKGQLNGLSQDISALKRRVDALEKQASQSSASQSQPASQKAKGQKDTGALDKAHVRDLVCKAGAKFSSQMDAALNLSEESDAEDKTDEALAELKSTLAPYSEDKGVSRFLSLAGMWAWDTSSAVGLQSSVEGNREFLEYISRYKKRFDLFCEGKTKTE